MMTIAIERIYKRAIELFKSNITQDSLVNTRGKVEKPIPVLEPSGKVNSWLICITVGKIVVGFMQIDNDLRILRYSSFQRIPESLQGCPPASAWLNKKNIIARAKTMATAQDILSSPVLTYDRNPSRIVWAITAINKSGERRTIHVAGEYVYVKNKSENSEGG